MSPQPPSFARRRYTGRRLDGIRYENKVHSYLESFYGDRYLAGPWLHFLDDRGDWRWCQPDGLILDFEGGRIVIVEVKYQFTADAWWQVRRLYEPVLRALFPARLWKFEACQIVKWYDVAIDFPERTVLAHEPDLHHDTFKVHIWSPR
jgi:hypothetical protein